MLMIKYKYYLQDEAFGIWREQWGKLYDEKSRSRQVINYIMDNYCLVNLVDNDFPKESTLFGIVHRMLKLRQERHGTLYGNIEFKDENEKEAAGDAVAMEVVSCR